MRGHGADTKHSLQLTRRVGLLCPLHYFLRLGLDPRGRLGDLRHQVSAFFTDQHGQTAIILVEDCLYAP